MPDKERKMAVYDLEEQEQIAQFKAWWEHYGNLIVGVVLAVVIGFVGWRLWDRYQAGQADKAGAVYFTLEEAAARNDARQTFELAGKLIGQYGGTLQAQLGALLSAGCSSRNTISITRARNSNGRPKMVKILSCASSRA